jgi:hypothetical protein
MTITPSTYSAEKTLANLRLARERAGLNPTQQDCGAVSKIARESAHGCMSAAERMEKLAQSLRSPAIKSVFAPKTPAKSLAQEALAKTKRLITELGGIIAEEIARPHDVDNESSSEIRAAEVGATFDTAASLIDDIWEGLIR